MHRTAYITYMYVPQVDPQDVMKLLNALFPAFDKLCDEFGIYKVQYQVDKRIDEL